MKLFDNCNISSTHVDMNVKQQPAFITNSSVVIFNLACTLLKHRKFFFKVNLVGFVFNFFIFWDEQKIVFFSKINVEFQV